MHARTRTEHNVFESLPLLLPTHPPGATNETAAKTRWQRGLMGGHSAARPWVDGSALLHVPARHGECVHRFCVLCYAAEVLSLCRLLSLRLCYCCFCLCKGFGKGFACSTLSSGCARTWHQCGVCMRVCVCVCCSGWPVPVTPCYDAAGGPAGEATVMVLWCALLVESLRHPLFEPGSTTGYP